MDSSREHKSGSVAGTRREIGSWIETVPDVVLAVHGGVSGPRKELEPGHEQRIRSGMENALRAGYATLYPQAHGQTGGSSLSAVEAAVRVMEDDPIFNAGRGAVFTADGKNSLDAAIMEGRTKKAGAVAMVDAIKNPIAAAKAVMERSQHVLLAGEGAMEFARQAGLEMVDPSYFRTDERWRQYQTWLQSKREVRHQFGGDAKKDHSWSTVGAVAVDTAGTVSAGTSTGGLMGKRFGRIGDSPILGAGTYADNAAAAISSTGWGEFFIRFAAAFNIVSRIKLSKLSAAEAADIVINGEIHGAGGDGGVIVLTPEGQYAAAFNSRSMARGYVTRSGNIVTAIDDR